MNGIPNAGMLQILCCWEFQRQPEKQDPEFKAGAALQLFQRSTSSVFPSVWFDFGLFVQAVKPFKCNGYTNNNNLSWNYLLNSVLSWNSDLWAPAKNGYQCEIQCSFAFSTQLKIRNYPKCLTPYILFISKAYQDFSIYPLFKKWGKSSQIALKIHNFN